MITVIKGVNRQVLEITETNNLYYEKALLVVRPEYCNAQQAVLEKEARQMLRRMYPPSAIKCRQRFFYWLKRLGLSALVGGAVALLVNYAVLT